MGRKQTEQTKAKISAKLKGRRVGAAASTYGKITVELRYCKTCSQSFYVEPYKKKKYCSLKCASVNNGGLRYNCGKKGSWYFCKWTNTEVYLDSTWELEYVTWLDRNNIAWSRPSYFSWTDDEGKPRRYYPDFYLVKENKYIDIKNDYLIQRDEVKINKVVLTHKINLEVVNRKRLDEILAGVVQQ